MDPPVASVHVRASATGSLRMRHGKTHFSLGLIGSTSRFMRLPNGMSDYAATRASTGQLCCEGWLKKAGPSPTVREATLTRLTESCKDVARNPKPAAALPETSPCRQPQGFLPLHASGFSRDLKRFRGFTLLLPASTRGTVTKAPRGVLDS